MSRAVRKRATYALTGLAYMEALDQAPLAYKGEPVATLGMLAQANNVTAKTVTRQWEESRKAKRTDGAPKFVEGEHFFVIRGAELDALKSAAEAGSKNCTPSLGVSRSGLYGIGKRARSLVILTRAGAVKLATRLDSDEADDVVNALVDYFLHGKRQVVPSDVVERIAAEVLSRISPFMERQHHEIQALRADRTVLEAQLQRADAYAARDRSHHARQLALAGHAAKRERVKRKIERDFRPMTPRAAEDWTVEGQFVMEFENGTLSLVACDAGGDA